MSMANVVEIEPGTPLAARYVEVEVQLTAVAEEFGLNLHDKLPTQVYESQAASLLEDRAVPDLTPEELTVIDDAAVCWSVESATKQYRALQRSALFKDGIPSWTDIASFTIGEARSHVQDMSSSFDHLAGYEITKRSMTERSAADVATAMTCTFLEDSAGSRPTKVQPLKRVLEQAADLYVGLTELGTSAINSKAARTSVASSVEALESTKFEKFSDADRNRYDLFTKLLEAVSRSATKDFWHNFRDYDTGYSVVDIAGCVVTEITDFMKELTDDNVTELMRSPDTTDLAIRHLARQAAATGRYCFADAAADGLAVVNTGRRKFRYQTGALLFDRNESNDSSESTKQEIFNFYVPELRKLGVIQGGSFYDFRLAYEAAADLLDTMYSASEDDVTQFPTAQDFYLTIASYLGIGPFYNAVFGIGDLDESQKVGITDSLDELFIINMQDQDAVKGNCYGVDPELFYPSRGASVKPLRAICADCPTHIHERCETAGLSEKFGIWAGISERKRRATRKALKIVLVDDIEEGDGTTVVEPDFTPAEDVPEEDMVATLDDIEFPGSNVA